MLRALFGRRFQRRRGRASTPTALNQEQEQRGDRGQSDRCGLIHVAGSPAREQQS